MPKKILIVDDNLQLRSMVKSYLMQEGFSIETASNGKEALFVARYEKPDLILLDIMMPEMDGYEFIRAYSRDADTPVILLTAKIEENDGRVCGVSGARVFVGGQTGGSARAFWPRPGAGGDELAVQEGEYALWIRSGTFRNRPHQ